MSKKSVEEFTFPQLFRLRLASLVLWWIATAIPVSTQSFTEDSPWNKSRISNVSLRMWRIQWIIKECVSQQRPALFMMFEMEQTIIIIDRLNDDERIDVHKQLCVSVCVTEMKGEKKSGKNIEGFVLNSEVSGVVFFNLDETESSSRRSAQTRRWFNTKMSVVAAVRWSLLVVSFDAVQGVNSKATFQWAAANLALEMIDSADGWLACGEIKSHQIPSDPIRSRRIESQRAQPS